MALGRDALELQERLGYNFSDYTHLEASLTHSSYTNEMRQRGIKAESNERLEFLGDAVLEIVISEYLFSNFQKYREGALTKMRQQLVCERTLARVASRLSLGDYVNLGNGEESSDCRNLPKILADCLEALIAAIYLDSKAKGSDEYKTVILSLFEDEINGCLLQRTDYKSRLQQLIEQDGSSILEYKIVSEEGPQHKRLFTVVALVNNNEVGKGSATTKKGAQMQAAKMALELFGVNI